jgi:hypothetical protein
MFLDHTQRRSTVGRTLLDEWSARRRDLYLTTHDTHNRQISMPKVGFKPNISVSERPQAARLLRSWVRIPPGAWIFVCCECRVVTGRGLCCGSRGRPEDYYQQSSVVPCDPETHFTYILSLLYSYRASVFYVFRCSSFAGERPQAPRLLISWVRIPPWAWIFVCGECREVAGRGLWNELITRPEESYGLWCVVVCD